MPIAIVEDEVLEMALYRPTFGSTPQAPFFRLMLALLAALAFFAFARVAAAAPGDAQERVRYQEFAKGGYFDCPKDADRVMQSTLRGKEEFCKTKLGTRHGYYLRLHSDGDTWAVLGYYHYGRKNGVWINFDKDGMVSSKRYYVEGVRKPMPAKLPKPAGSTRS